MQPERRYASDGKAYTKAEFKKFYRGFKEWDQAKPALSEKPEEVQQQLEQPVEEADNRKKVGRRLYLPTEDLSLIHI